MITRTCNIVFQATWTVTLDVEIYFENRRTVILLSLQDKFKKLLVPSLVEEPEKWKYRDYYTSLWNDDASISTTEHCKGKNWFSFSISGDPT